MRLFAAVNFDDPFKNAILSYQRELRGAALSGNFSRPENLHLTLAFIGEVRDASKALRAVKSVSVDPFEVRLSKSGHFGNLYWLGVESGGKGEDLAGRVRDALRREGVSFDPKPFKAHITVAREVEWAGEPVRFPVPKASAVVSRISLMKSERINGRLVYSEIR